MAPYFERAATLGPNSPLKAEVARIRTASSDPKVQAAAALSLVEDKVRYLALTTYNAALKLRPRLAESLFGRALTRLRLGQTDLAQADLAAARASDQRVDITFAGYGLSAASGDGKARPAVPG